MDYVPITSKDQKEMLAKIGINSIDDLVDDVKPRCGELNLPSPMSEMELVQHVTALSEKIKFQDTLLVEVPTIIIRLR